MPEGHTLHRLARELSTAFGGRVVRVGSPQGRFADSAALLDGAVLVGAEAWGKHLFVELVGDRFVHVHLGLYGKFAVHTGAAEVPPPVGQVRLRLVAAEGDAYADLRGATTCELVTPDQRDLVVARSARTRSGRTPTRRGPGSGSGAAGPRSAACSWTRQCSPVWATCIAPRCCSGTGCTRCGPATRSAPASSGRSGTTWWS